MLVPNPSPRRHHQHYTAPPQPIYHIRGGGADRHTRAEAIGQILREATRSLWWDMRSPISYKGRGKKEGPDSNFVFIFVGETIQER
jgi:hypothetical protein